MKLHYVVHCTFRGWWDYLVPKEKEEERGLIETYQCLMCPRRFRNNHNKKQYPGRGSMVCHLATEHGQLLKAMRADTEMDMQSEIEALDKLDQGKFLEMGIPDVPDNELYVAKESYTWKFEQSQLKEKRNQEGNSDPNQPKIVPKYNTELAEMRNNNYSRGRQFYECTNVLKLRSQHRIKSKAKTCAALSVQPLCQWIKSNYIMLFIIRLGDGGIISFQKRKKKNWVKLKLMSACCVREDVEIIITKSSIRASMSSLDLLLKKWMSSRRLNLMDPNQARTPKRSSSQIVDNFSDKNKRVGK